MEFVILVDTNDQAIGQAEKMEAHEKGLLHRAFSICIWNSKGEILLQRRAFTKYHGGGLWTNTCCSHPRPGELLDEAVHRRLLEEMGFDTEMREIGSFIYQAVMPNNLIEHEYDHVFSGFYDGDVVVNPEEVQEYQWIKPEALQKWMSETPDEFTYWFREIVKKFPEMLILYSKIDSETN